MVRLSPRASEQVFLSGSSLVHAEWSVAGGDDREEDTTEIIILCFRPIRFSCVGSNVRTRKLFLSQPCYSSVFSVIDCRNEGVSLLPELA